MASLDHGCQGQQQVGVFNSLGGISLDEGGHSYGRSRVPKPIEALSVPRSHSLLPNITDLITKVVLVTKLEGFSREFP